MPFKSQAQERWMFATHPKMANQWATETPGFKTLPDHVQKKAKMSALSKIAGIR